MCLLVKKTLFERYIKQVQFIKFFYNTLKIQHKNSIFTHLYTRIHTRARAHTHTHTHTFITVRKFKTKRFKDLILCVFFNLKYVQVQFYFYTAYFIL